MLGLLPVCGTRILRRLAQNLLCASWFLLGGSHAVLAQGLIWSLPEDGSWIRYEGTYHQDNVRPEAGAESISLDWIRHLTIKSVGREEAEYEDLDGQKKTGPCRWIEIKVVTGKKGAGEIDAGQVGEKIYKVLVPEERILGRTVDDSGIPVAYIPIVKGVRRVGDQRKSPLPIKSKALNIYPAIALLRHYKTLQQDSDQPQDPQSGLGAVSAKKYSASVELESQTMRSIHSAQLWRSKEVPFGLARWVINIQREEKADTQPRSDFKTVSKITVDMKAQETGTDATSELPDE